MKDLNNLTKLQFEHFHNYYERNFHLYNSFNVLIEYVSSALTFLKIEKKQLWNQFVKSHIYTRSTNMFAPKGLEKKGGAIENNTNLAPQSWQPLCKVIPTANSWK